VQMTLLMQTVASIIGLNQGKMGGRYRWVD
jgi:hypothetical protein